MRALLCARFRASIISLERSTMSPVCRSSTLPLPSFFSRSPSTALSAMSRISSASVSAYSSRARAYWFRNASFSASQRMAVERLGILVVEQIVRRLLPSTSRSQIASASCWLYCWAVPLLLPVRPDHGLAGADVVVGVVADLNSSSRNLCS